MDLAVLGRSPDEVVRLLLGEGDGSFVEGIERGVGGDPSSLVVADFNGDGAEDVLVANAGSMDLSLLRGDGAGDLSEEIRLALEGAPEQILADDLDRDGRLDIVIRFSTAEEGVAVLYGTVGGGFTGPVTVPMPVDVAFYSPRGIAVGDMNGDRYPDLIVTTVIATTLFLGREGRAYEFHGTFAAVADTPLLGDFDGDRRQDVIQIGYELLEILINQGPTGTRFEADKSTLRWPRDPVAVSYSVYRGHLDDLTDEDGNDLPDGGYGQCQTGLDDDPTDNRFIDLDVPSPGHGFFYLTAAVDSVGERGSGCGSSGLVRSSANPCP